MAKHRRKKWRLYQLIAASGLVKSKEDAVRLAREGKITVNENVMESLHYQVHPFKDDIRVEGKKIEFKENRRYFVLNKPKGVETTKQQMLKFLHGKVDDKEIRSFAPVGRLDKESTGLLILTNDGRLGRRVLDPLTKRAKVYRATVKGKITEEEAEKLRKGVRIMIEVNERPRPYTTLPAQVRIIRAAYDQSEVELSITEGKKRQVRKMLKAVGHEVTRLQRVAIAKLQLGALKPGEVKEYPKDEMYRLLFE
jgi:pseudouridine synthase